MWYPFITLDDDTQIVHSEMLEDHTVKVYMETPDEKCCFRHATCTLPKYEWSDIYHYSETEIKHLEKVIRSMAHLIIEFSQKGGIENASNF